MVKKNPEEYCPNCEKEDVMREVSTEIKSCTECNLKLTENNFIDFCTNCKDHRVMRNIKGVEDSVKCTNCKTKISGPDHENRKEQMIKEGFFE